MSHGSSPAAWTAVLLCLLGITVGAVGLIPEPNWIVFTIGVVLTLASGLVGLVMSAAGLGGDRGEDHAERPEGVDEHRPLVGDQ